MDQMTATIWQSFWQQQSTIILDGGLATELEALGCDLNDPLWSARLLLEDPELIKQVHTDYLAAGADVIIAASYQATVPGFVARGMTVDAAEALIQKSVAIACQARDEFWDQTANREGRQRPLVAASVGPYGAYLANGAEYTGDYDLDEDGLVDFHHRRWQLLIDAGPDLLACETIPSLPEAQAYGRLASAGSTPIWLTFTARNGAEISDGTPIEVVGELADTLTAAVAVGINCTPPRFLPELIERLRTVTTKPIVVYPNSGETYDPENKVWLGQAIPEEFGTSGREWRKLGAGLIGGCCRTRPAHIVALSTRLKQFGRGQQEGERP